MTTSAPLSTSLGLVAALIGGAFLANLILGRWTHGQELGWVTGLGAAMFFAALAIVLALPGLIRQVGGRRLPLIALSLGALEVLACAALWLRAAG